MQCRLKAPNITVCSEKVSNTLQVALWEISIDISTVYSKPDDKYVLEIIY